MAVVEITKANFEEEVVKSEIPVLVDFWAAWCGPCKMLSPLVEQIAETAEGFKVGKVNVDDEQELAAKFNIMSIPTLLVFKNGEVAGSSVGVVPKEKILELLR